MWKEHSPGRTLYNRTYSHSNLPCLDRHSKMSAVNRRTVSAPNGIQNQLESLESLTPSENPKRVFKKGQFLGKGSYAKVYRGQVRGSSEEVAIKVMPFPRVGDREATTQVRNEICNLKRCHHRNIVTYYNSCAYVNVLKDLKRELWLVTEYINGKTLYDIVRSDRGMRAMTTNHIAAIIQECLRGLAYLHDEHQILHRDVKSANIMISRQGKVKIIDLGLSIVEQENKDTEVGTYDYMAPEMVSGEPYGPGVDIWSIGIMIIELLIGKLPNINKSKKTLVKSLKNKKRPAIPYHSKYNGYISRAMKRFIKLCLRVEQADRPTAQTLLADPFLYSASPLSRMGEIVRLLHRYDGESFRRR